MTTVSFPLNPLFQFREQTTGNLHTFQAPELHRFLETLWRRVGADDDAITILENGELYEPGIISGNTIELLEEIEEVEYEQPIDSRLSEALDRVDEIEESISDSRISEALERIEEIDDVVPSSKINELYDERLKGFSVSSAHTTSGNELIIATATLTVTLNDKPKDFEFVEVKSAVVGTVTIDGNGNTIDGSSTLTISHKYDSPKLRYSIDADEWLIV